MYQAAAINSALPNGGVAIAAAAAPSFGQQDHIVERAEALAAVSLPVVEVVTGGDRVIGTGRGATPIAEVLPERLGALDRGLVDLLVFRDAVRVAVAGERAHARAALVAALDNIIFDQRIGGPTVDTEHILPIENAGIVANRSRAAGIPAFASGDITNARPGQRIVAGRAERHRDIARAMPQRIVEAVIRSGGVAGDGLRLERWNRGDTEAGKEEALQANAFKRGANEHNTFSHIRGLV